MLAFPRDDDRHRLHRLGLVRRGRAGRLNGRILPCGEATERPHDCHEQQSGSDPTTTTQEGCPPTRLATGTLAIRVRSVLGADRTVCDEAYRSDGRASTCVMSAAVPGILWIRLSAVAAQSSLLVAR